MTTRFNNLARIPIGQGSAAPCQDYRLNAFPTQNAPPSDEISVSLRHH